MSTDTSTRTSRASTNLIPACADRPGDDPIFALNAQANELAASGRDVINSTLGALMEDDGRLAVMPSVFEAFQRIPIEKSAPYAPISGPPGFLRAVVDDLFGADSTMASWAVAAATPGGTGACHHAIANFIGTGEKVLVPSYYWGPYGILADHAERGISTFNMFDGEGHLDTEALAAGLEAHARDQGRALLILNTPCNNPTGFSMHDADWRKLHATIAPVAERVPVTVLLDFAYEKFAAPESICWPEHVQRLAQVATVLFAWTASKSFAQYGSRIGACVALSPDAGERERLKNALGYSCRGTWSNCNHLGMLAIAELLSDPDLRARSLQERERLRQLLNERVEVFKQHAAEKGLSHPRYEGGFFVAVFTPDANKTCARMVEDGVFVVPLNGAVRVALCATPKAHIPRLVESLAEGVRAAGA